MDLCKKSGGDDNSGQLITAEQKPGRSSIPARQSWYTYIDYVTEVNRIVSQHCPA